MYRKICILYYKIVIIVELSGSYSVNVCREIIFGIRLRKFIERLVLHYYDVDVRQV
jgi:hypothetical protein